MEPQIVVRGTMHQTNDLGPAAPVPTPQQPFHEIPVATMDNEMRNERPVGEERRRMSAGKMGNQQQQHTRPLKQLVNPDSLYRYLNWEDPARTVGSYAVVMSVLLGTHYLPLTQTALKTGATVLGVVSTIEYAHRSFTTNTLLARLRPKEYRKVPEPVLNDTLKDVHDLVQYLVVKAQKVVYGEELEKTFAAFVGLSVLYWLVKMVSPFTLAVLSVHMLYIAPLIKSPRGREVINEAKTRAEDLSNAALENTQGLANDSRAKASELSTKAQETAQDAQRRLGELAQNGSQAAADVTAQVKDKVSGASGAAVESASKLPQMGRNVAQQTSAASGNAANNAGNTLHQASNRAASALDNAKQQTQSTISGTLGISSQGAEKKGTSSTNHTAAGETGRANATRAVALDQPHGGVVNTAQPLAFDLSSPVNNGNDTVDSGDSHYELKSTMEGLKDVTGSTPRQGLGDSTPPVANMAAEVAEGDQAGTRGIMGRPRGVPLADIDGASGFGKHQELNL